MTDHDLSKWTILSLTLTTATLIVGLVINDIYAAKHKNLPYLSYISQTQVYFTLIQT